MSLLFIERMQERLEISRQESDTSYFYDLLFYGEMLLKLTAMVLTSCLNEDKDRHKYRQLHTMVRADGIGNWVGIIDEILSGPSSQYLASEAYEFQRQLTQKVGGGQWQYDASNLLFSSLLVLNKEHEELPTKIDARKWFALFAETRNGTRGHGAVPPASCSKMALTCSPKSVPPQMLESL